MIDNPADYERIFRPKARLPRSPSHQGVSAQPTVSSSFLPEPTEINSKKSEVSSEVSAPSYSSSTGFHKSPSINDAPSTVITTAAGKLKTSQSSSPPPSAQVLFNFHSFKLKILIFFHTRMMQKHLLFVHLIHPSFKLNK